MESIIGSKVTEWLISLGMTGDLAAFVKTVIFVLVVIFLSFLANYITKKIIVSIVILFIKRTKTKWDDILLENKVFTRLSHFAPALVIFYSANLAFESYPVFIEPVRNGTYIYMILIGILAIDSFINALHSIYRYLPVSKDRSIRGYIQVLKIILYFIGIMLIISVVFNTNLSKLFTGLGALAAVLMFVFKDTILGFVASIQLSANNMVKPGDWIEMPKYNADGTVKEINLNTVKVQNWDKTISTIPTYALVSDSFSNWKGMEESGGRRIKRSINIDMKSVKFCTPEMLKKFKKIHVLKDYLESKEKELAEYNKKYNIDESVKVNGRRLTNLGTFRKYVEGYLTNHPKIHNNMTFLVRHLQPTDMGIPIEIYVFSSDQKWANYEAIQADIFDHILAVVHEFDLKIFQSPTGDDFQKLIE
jgi:miniconductance mechanosensitive channel